jgi:hypothetical protein
VAKTRRQCGSVNNPLTLLSLMLNHGKKSPRFARKTGKNFSTFGKSLKRRQKISARAGQMSAILAQNRPAIRRPCLRRPLSRGFRAAKVLTEGPPLVPPPQDHIG